MKKFKISEYTLYSLIFLSTLEKVRYNKLSEYLNHQFEQIIYVLLFLLVYLILSKKYLFDRFIIIIVLLSISFSWLGPYFEPRSDPIYHANVLFDSLDKNVYKDSVNRAYINRAFFYLFHKIFNFNNHIEKNWIILYVFHLFSTTLLSTSCYASSRILGLDKKWSLFSVLLMILFYGTNRFSFFSYYSLAPTILNNAIYWVVSAYLLKYLFKKNLNIRYIVQYIFIAISLIPMLYLNHKQEAAFLLLIIELSIIVVIWRVFILFRILLLIILFIPYLYIVKLYVIPDSIINQIIQHSDYYRDILGIWMISKWNAPRLLDSFGLIGGIGIISSFIILVISIFNKKYFNLTFIIPGLYPLWIMFIPLNFFLWIYIINTQELFWRIAYFHQYWISISFVLFSIEQKINEKQ
jgi:hypothetical protein